jgi:uncharacterized protein YjiS (DUF1127 family)
MPQVVLERSCPGLAHRSKLVAAAERLMIWIDRARGRRILAALDDRMLDDIGIDRGTLQTESRKPFWQG